MNLEEEIKSLPIGQLISMGFDGHEVPDRVQKLITKENIGGCILFSRNIENLEQVVKLNTQITSLGNQEFPILISVDQEGGRVARLRGICSDLPSMRAIGSASKDDLELSYRVGAMMARELVSLGFHLNFTPVVDVDTNPDNPVIGERAFSSDTKEVCEISTRMIEGMQQSGIAACAKHFPGHGDTHQDSHYTLPSIEHSFQRMYNVELPPFAASANAGVASIMTAHVMFKAIDETYPATLSKKILQGLLRERIGYQGLIISDDLEMKALDDNYSIEEMMILGLNAGVDHFLICHSIDKVKEALKAIRKGLLDGRIDIARVKTALLRNAELKEKFIGALAPPILEDAQRIVRSKPHIEMCEQLREDNSSQKRGSSLVDTL